MLTEADAAESDDWDLSQAKRASIGRPSLGEGHSPRVSFRTSPKLYEALRQRAADEGRSVSEVAREAMERYVAT